MNSDQPWATLKHALVQRSCKGDSCEKGTDSDSSSLMKFSASCFYFAQELSDALGAEAPPIGLVHTAWGGSTIEQWLTNESIAACEYVTPAASHQEFHDTRVLPYTGMSLKGFVWCEWHSCAFPSLLCACACVAPADCLTLPRLHASDQGENNCHAVMGNSAAQAGYSCEMQVPTSPSNH